MQGIKSWLHCIPPWSLSCMFCKSVQSHLLARPMPNEGQQTRRAGQEKLGGALAALCRTQGSNQSSDSTHTPLLSTQQAAPSRSFSPHGIVAKMGQGNSRVQLPAGMSRTMVLACPDKAFQLLQFPAWKVNQVMSCHDLLGRDAFNMVEPRQ